MRKITLFLFSLLALLASVTTAQAQEMKSPYKVDFNSAIATDDHARRLGPRSGQCRKQHRL